MDCPILVNSVPTSIVVSPVTLKALVDRNRESIIENPVELDWGIHNKKANKMIKPMYRKNICRNEWIEDLLCCIFI